ncbi:MAG: dTDP-4-dehydrorhamnose reductase family protein [Macellibacteroides fermentans]|uniref:dTDP-4-dehydrorhamnose reductase family protein n=1 Tax=Macellibacteroides fermentans TaxID=879969 RepID=UPI003ACBE2AC
MDKIKVLILGSTGMAGHIVYYYLKGLNKYDITNISYRNKLDNDSIILDVRKIDELSSAISEIRPQIIINCIGVLIRGANEHPENAIFLNSYLPHVLKRLAESVNGKLIHISTDCVFSGEKGFYSENDFRDADDIYGRSKALGEIRSNKHLTLRTSIIGPEIKQNGEGLFHWFMNQTGSVNGYTTAFWGGITTLELAKIINIAIVNNYNGLIQVSNGEKISKYELLCLIKMIWNKDDINIIEYNGKKVNKSLQKSSSVNLTIPSYKEMLQELHIWMIKNKTTYNY